MSRYSLKVLLETFDDFELVGEAQEEIEILRMCDQLQPDVVIMSLGFKSANGIHTIRMLREQFPQVQIVALSHSRLVDDLALVIEAGASRFLIKDETEGRVIGEAIREAVH
jgi:DNA-binding NarL/FixJ family response regulator